MPVQHASTACLQNLPLLHALHKHEDGTAMLRGSKTTKERMHTKTNERTDGSIGMQPCRTPGFLCAHCLGRGLNICSVYIGEQGTKLELAERGYGEWSLGTFHEVLHMYGLLLASSIHTAAPLTCSKV